MRKARLSWISLRSTIEAELAEADIAAPIKEAGAELRRIGEDINADLPDFSDIPGFTPENHEATTRHVNAEADSRQQESTDADNDSDQDENA